MEMRFEIRSQYILIRFDVQDKRDLEDKWCGNFLDALVRIEMPGHHLVFRSCVTLEELMDFHADLERLHRELRGNVYFPKTSRPYLHLQVSIDKLGHLHWQANYNDRSSLDIRLQFKFDSDQSYLPELIEQIARIIVACPFKERPEGHPPID